MSYDKRADMYLYESAFKAALQIARIAADLVPPSSCFVSLGQNCNTARYLHLIGKKECSFPFDWIFSSPMIVEHCICDRFETYLDKRFFVDNEGPVVGHSSYHLRMFNHRSPVSGDGYGYYQRCVQRFLSLYDSDRPLVFFSTALPEHDRRPGWSKGFVFDFVAPENFDLLSEYEGLIELFSKREGHTSLVIIQQRTEMPHPRIEVVEKTKNVLAVRFDACGSNDGVNYVEPIDDSLCRIFYAAIAYS